MHSGSCHLPLTGNATFRTNASGKVAQINAGFFFIFCGVHFHIACLHTRKFEQDLAFSIFDNAIELKTADFCPGEVVVTLPQRKMIGTCGYFCIAIVQANGIDRLAIAKINTYAVCIGVNIAVLIVCAHFASGGVIIKRAEERGRRNYFRNIYFGCTFCARRGLNNAVRISRPYVTDESVAFRFKAQSGNGGTFVCINCHANIGVVDIHACIVYVARIRQVDHDLQFFIGTNGTDGAERNPTLITAIAKRAIFVCGNVEAVCPLRHQGEFQIRKVRKRNSKAEFSTVASSNRVVDSGGRTNHFDVIDQKYVANACFVIGVENHTVNRLNASVCPNGAKLFAVKVKVSPIGIGFGHNFKGIPSLFLHIRFGSRNPLTLRSAVIF